MGQGLRGGPLGTAEPPRLSFDSESRRMAGGSTSYDIEAHPTRSNRFQVSPADHEGAKNTGITGSQGAGR